LLEACLFERFSSRGFLLRLRYRNGSEALTSHSSLIDGKMLVSDEGRIEGINRSSLDILGYPEYAEVIGKSVSTIVGAEISLLTQTTGFCWVREHQALRTKRRIQIETFKLDDGTQASRRDEPSRGLRSIDEESVSDPTPAECWRDVVLESALQKATGLQERNISLLITGESGVGKDYLVRRLHACGPRHDKPLVAINCAAIPRDLIESELFGYEGGSFTGARSKGKKGKFLEADGGALFLDEIGDMALDLQATLLRVLDSSEVVPIGSSRPIRVDVRVVAATNRRLRDMVKDGSFRRDLYYRLNGVQLWLPPLRERPDRSQLIEMLLRIEQDALGGERKTLSDEVRSLFFRHPWPGNIREARNVLRASIAVARTHIIGIDDLPHDFLEEAEFDLPPRPQRSRQEERGTLGVSRHEPTQSALADWEERAVRSALELSEGNVAEAARNLGITRATLYHKMDRYGLRGDRRAMAKR
jgi:transcriptional regulator with PAS, ATPase and Fis domain